MVFIYLKQLIVMSMVYAGIFNLLDPRHPFLWITSGGDCRRSARPYFVRWLGVAELARIIPPPPRATGPLVV